MKQFIIYILCVVCAILVSCTGNEQYSNDKHRLVNIEESSPIDSSYHRFKNADDGLAIPLANQVFYLMHSDEVTDSLIQYSSGANKEEVIANADYWMSYYLFAKQRFKEAMTIGQIALDEAVSIDDKELIVSCNSQLSVIYMRLGLFDEAAQCLQVCLDESTRTGDKEGMSSDLSNMAALFLSLKQYDHAKSHIDKAIEIERELGRDDVMAIRLGIASETYMMLNQLSEAEGYARMAYDLDSKGGRENKAAIRLSQLASVQIKQKHYDDAKQSLNQAMPMLKNTGNTYSYIICENQLGDICIQENDFANAETHYLAALNLASSKDLRYLKQRALHGLWKALKSTDIARAANYLEQYTTLTDTLHNEATDKQLATMQTKFEYSELQAENERLVYENRVSTLRWIVVVAIILLVVCIFYYIKHIKSKSNIIAKQTDVMIDLISEKAADDEVKLTDDTTTQEQKDKDDCVEDGQSDAQSEESLLSQRDSEFLDKFVSHVNKRLAQGGTIDIVECSSHMCVSPRHLSRKIMAITGFTPSAYVNRIKITKAKRYLDTSPDMNITEVSTKSGFEDLAYFGKIFRQIEGVTTTQYRNREP